MNVGGFSKHQNKTKNTDRYKCFFHRSCLSQVNVNTLQGMFDQWSELQVAKCPILHVLSSSYNVSSFELWNEKKATQRRGLRDANDIVLNQDRVCYERVYADKVVSNLWFVRSFSSQHHSNFIANNATEIVSQFRTEKFNTRSFICKVKLNFFVLRDTLTDTAFVVIGSFLNKSVHGINNIRNGRLETGFQIVKLRRRSKCFIKEHKFYLYDILVHWWLRYFQNCNLPLTFQIQLLRKKFVK